VSSRWRCPDLRTQRLDGHLPHAVVLVPDDPVEAVVFVLQHNNLGGGDAEATLGLYGTQT